eukprot:CAMPEP_0181213300 /NCGR_PEP_ID=MMETSP1096-20121128/24826_1 /TAXON_ID=156174 ORGANISM="Chrysochromulina ericina, Strain CCMP281" /NCGR_SAMPLE_ID=MMETSP1096 /ASSEMBLY_ACC=CAM_ASM_000453 /LENGTH=131 /DNA_ID=CAMNT_0023304919 /DNA_START=134 /DNA_END=529 /DNA_ORIENTATION=-
MSHGRRNIAITELDAEIHEQYEAKEKHLQSLQNKLEEADELRHEQIIRITRELEEHAMHPDGKLSTEEFYTKNDELKGLRAEHEREYDELHKQYEAAEEEWDAYSTTRMQLLDLYNNAPKLEPSGTAKDEF